MSVFDYDPEFIKEITYSPTDEELGDIRAPGPVGSVGGFAGRMLRKNVADPIRGMFRSVKKAQEGSFKSPEEMGRAALEFAGNMVGMPGGSSGLGSGARIARPWQSRTLDTITGVLPTGKKFPDTATPQTWLSKLKGAGLPKEEVEVAESFLTAADPRSKLDRQQLASALDEGRNKERYMAARNELMVLRKAAKDEGYAGIETQGDIATMDRALVLRREMEQAATDRMALPTLGVTKTELGGPEWAVAQDKLDKNSALIDYLRKSIDDRLLIAAKEKYPNANINTSNLHEYKNRELVDSISSTDEGFAYDLSNYNRVLRENMKLIDETTGKRPRWSQYNIEGVENPREVLYHAKPKSGESEYINSDMETHYGQDKGKNLLFHQREGELTLPNGKKSTHISEQQSDWHSEYEKATKISAKKQELAAKAVERNDIEFLRGEIPDGFDVDNMSDSSVLGYAKRYLVRRAGMPEPPMKDTWYKMGFKDAVKRAVEAGHDYVTWDTADTQIKRWPAGEGAKKYFDQHYDEKLVKLAAKEYGVKPEKVVLQTDEIAGLSGVSGELVPIKKTNEVWRIPITEDMKRKILLEGQYFSKRTAKPGGQNAEVAA